MSDDDQQAESAKVIDFPKERVVRDRGTVKEEQEDVTIELAEAISGLALKLARLLKSK